MGSTSEELRETFRKVVCHGQVGNHLPYRTRANVITELQFLSVES